MELENQNNLEQNLQDISVIKKEEHNPTDLEESINQCILNLNNDGEKKGIQKNNNQKPKTPTQQKKAYQQNQIIKLKKKKF